MSIPPVPAARRECLCIRRSCWTSVAMVWTALWLSLIPAVRGAQFTTQFQSTPTPAILNQSVAFSITITNVSSTDLRGMLLTNTLPDTVGLQSATTSLGTVTTSTAGRVVVNVGALPAGQRVAINMSFLVSSLVPLTNHLAVSATSATNSLELDSFATDFVTPVISGNADLGIVMTGPTQSILPGDELAYAIAVTNGGPATAVQPSVAISIPNGWTFGRLSPTNIAYSLTNQTVTAILTNLSPLNRMEFILHLQAASVGRFLLSASVAASGNVDPVSTNNTSRVTVTVDAPSTNSLMVQLMTAQQFNPQTGAVEQSVRVTNPGLSTITGFRIAASGVTNALLEATGTNHSLPFAVYPGTLAPGESVVLLLSFFVPSRQPLSSLAYIVTAEGSSLAPIPVGTVIRPNAGTWLNSKGFLLEFPSTVGRVYAVVYASDAAFSDATVSQPYILARATQTQWIDPGPPRTLSHPTNNGYRFYQVIQLP